MSRFLLFIGLFFFAMSSFTAGNDVAQFKTQLNTIAEQSFSGTPEEYKAFAEKQGNTLIEKSDQMLALANLTPEEKRFGLLMKYWGILHLYGFHSEQRNEHLEKFAASIEEIPEMKDLYRLITENFIEDERDTLFTITDPKVRAETYLKQLDRFLPYIEKYCTESDDRQVLNIAAELADRYDFDGSFRLVEITAEKLRPTVETLMKAEPRTFAKSVLGCAERIRQTGKELEYKGVSTTGDVVDVQEYKGKFVLLDFGYQRNESDIAVRKKLYDALHGDELELITHEPSGSREVALKKANDAGIPWTITCRSACYEKDLKDYYEDWGLTTALFLLDKNGVVMKQWSNSFCPEACDELKKFFPEKSDVLTEIAEVFRQKELERQQEIKSWYVKSQDSPVSELYSMRSTIENGIAPRGVNNFKDVLTPQIVSNEKLLLANILLDIPDLTSNQWRSAVVFKIDSLEELAQNKLDNDPDLEPTEAFAKMLETIEEMEKNPMAEGLNHVFLNSKIRLFFARGNYLNTKADPKIEYAKDFADWFIELFSHEIATIKALPKEKQNYGIVNHYANMCPQILLDAFDEIDEDGSQGLVSSFCERLSQVLRDSGEYRLEESAVQLENVARRSSSVGTEFEFECVLMNGEKWNVKDFRGKIVLVNFWATWCGPCLREFPNMKAQYEKYKEKGYEMLAYSDDNEVSDIIQFQEKNQYPWLVASRKVSVDQGLKDYIDFYGRAGIPVTFLVDRDGKVLFRMVGSDDEKLNQALEKAFAP